MPAQVKPEGLYAEALDAQMKKRGVSIRDLSISTGATYEHIRKLVKGIVTPSGILNGVICQQLHWDKKEAEKLIMRDQLKKKYGTMPQEVAGKNPAVIPFENVLPKLTQDQRDMFLTQMKAVAQGNKK